MQRLPNLQLQPAGRKRRASQMATALADVLCDPEMLLSKLEEALKVRVRAEGRAEELKAEPRKPPADDMALERFSFWMARRRTLFGLTRRALAGRTTEVRSLISQSLRDHGVPHALAIAVMDRLSAPRVVLGLLIRRMLAGVESVHGSVMHLMQEHIGCLKPPGDWPPSRKELARQLFSRSVRKSKVKPEWKKEVMYAGVDAPEISIIVAFDCDVRFIDAVTTMQLVFTGKNIEWIFVCDDPSLSAQIREYLSRRRSFFLQRTILILNSINYGRSLSRAIGAEAACGEFLLFMNSDIWIDDCAAIDVALQALRRNGFGIVGFRLLYEDGTIQHDSLRTKRSPHFQDLFIPDHLGNGLPPQLYRGKLVDKVEAVTSALMMMRRDLFTALGGFSQNYMHSDFEDVDLCLRAVQEGHTVGLVVTDECRHLERQSIRLKGGESAGDRMICIDCLKFNGIWGDYLAGARTSVRTAIDLMPSRGPS
jgi:Glycosyl transferase family 2